MRQDYYTVTPAVVRSTARQALQHALPVKNYGRLVSAKCLLELLLLVAALRSSLSAIVRRFRFGFCHETARKAVAANLPGQDELTQGLLDALYQFGSRALRRRRWVVAIDEHRDPFYGDRGAAGVTGGQKKHGTKYAYAYATAVLVHHRHRFTVGVMALTGGAKPHEIVATLLAQIQSRGLKVRGVVLDSGFDSGETLLLLQERQLSYTVPLRRKGDGKNRRNAAWDLAVGVVTEVDWKTEQTRREVKTAAVVVQRRREKDKKVYAFGGWDEAEARSQTWRARLAQRWYRKRFGIETSYRQMNECKGQTTKKDVVYRLLLVGLALLLRQVWVWLTAQVARDRGLQPTAWVADLRLARLAAWLADALTGVYREVTEIQLGSPLLPLDGFKV
jgi:Transposase DDE domain